MAIQQYRLYKYRSLDGEAGKRTRGIIADCQIFYAAPEMFNDPFECRFEVDMAEADLSYFGSATAEQVKVEMEKMLWRDANTAMCILSLTELNNQPLMWAHYADCHRGICIELSLSVPEPIHQVRYLSERPVLMLKDAVEATRVQSRFHDSIMHTFTTKSTDWEYEQEWRCILLERAHLFNLKSGTVTGIVFGLRTSADDKEAVRKWAAWGSPGAKFYQASLRPGSFEIQIDPIK